MLTPYRVLIRLFMPVMLLRLLWRSRQNPDYRASISQRLGYSLPPTADDSRPLVWIHAVSVGETLAIEPLLRRCLAAAEVRLLVTSTTPTGAEQVRKRFGSDVAQCWVPFDTPGAVTRFLNHWQPAVVAMVETEVWPTIALSCHQRGLPLLLLNARLSQRSARGYARVGSLARTVLSCFSHIVCQQTADARRFAALGIAKDKLVVTGSIKFDVPIADLRVQGRGLAAELGIDSARKVWLAASTHEGEDELVIAAHTAMQGALLILAPRHPERCGQVAALLRARELPFVRRSEQRPVSAHTKVLLVDTLGELASITTLVQVAFIGGSLVPRGGHNPLEAAAAGVAVITGPHTFNFQTIYRQMQARSACRVVEDGPALAAAVSELACNEMARERLSTAAEDYMEAHTGACERQYALLRRTYCGD